MWGELPEEEAGKEGAWKEVSRGQTAHLSRISPLGACPPIQETSLGLTASRPSPEKQSFPRESGNSGREGAERRSRVFGGP